MGASIPSISFSHAVAFVVLSNAISTTTSDDIVRTAAFTRPASNAGWTLPITAAANGLLALSNKSTNPAGTLGTRATDVQARLMTNDTSTAHNSVVVVVMVVVVVVVVAPVPMVVVACVEPTVVVGVTIVVGPPVVVVPVVDVDDMVVAVVVVLVSVVVVTVVDAADVVEPSVVVALVVGASVAGTTVVGACVHNDAPCSDTLLHRISPGFPNSLQRVCPPPLQAEPSPR